MQRLGIWIGRQITKTKSSQVWKLFLYGVKGQLDTKSVKPYNFYFKILTTAAMIGCAFYILQFRKQQMQTPGYNILIPSYVYSVREDSYIYWETVRRAKGMPTFLTYYKWDGKLMFEIDRAGKQTPIQVHKQIQNSSTFTSALFQYNFPASDETHSKITLYLKNLNNPYDLRNYLRLKPITIGDWIRTAYYMVYRELGLSNRWRYDEYVKKPDIYYRWEKLRLAFRLNRDRGLLYQNLDQIKQQLDFDTIASFFVWFI